MAVDVNSIGAAAKQAYTQASRNARSASSINEALDIQAMGFEQAMKVAFTMFIAQAKINGGTCTPNGPVSNAVIT